MESAKQREMLQICKIRTTGKRIALKGKFVFSTQEVLDMAKVAEKATADKESRTRRRKRPMALTVEEQEEEVPEDITGHSDSDCIVVQPRRSY